MSDLLYQSIKPLLFSLDPETAHRVTFALLHCVPEKCLTALYAPQVKPIQLLGLTFPNRVGLAAGLDKDGLHVSLLAALGFGFIEVGTVTPKPQWGNPKPRLFRLPKACALINRMGFNNQGVIALKQRLERLKFPGILGVNIGKNKETPLELAVDDYLYAFRALGSVADYITINLSSPNTPDLRKLQFGTMLQSLLKTLKAEQEKQQALYKKPLPLFVKIAPDLLDQELTEVVSILLENKIEGVIATNTTVNKKSVAQLSFGQEEGGLSGAPLKQISTEMIAKIKKMAKEKLVIIGVGGIFSGEDAKEKFDAGAQLVQLYTGLIYQGPGLIKEVATRQYN